MEFVAHSYDQMWTGCWTEDDGTFTFDASNALVKIMVYKPVISEVHFKVEGGTGPVTELVATNTLINQWEELTFDFSAVIGQTYSRLVIFPDFATRTEDHTIYFDNIFVPDGVVTVLPEPTTTPPVPSHAEADVISIYTEVYTNEPGTDFNPYWGQTTTVTVDYVAAGNNTLKYENLNYQGTQLVNLDVSLYEYFHVDFWTPNASFLDFYLISPGPVETPYPLPVSYEEWVSVDIPLSAFDPVNLADVFQFKVVGTGTVYFDNWYFWKTPSTGGSDATLSDLQVDGVTVPGFDPAVLNYDFEVPAGSPVPVVTAVPNDPLATYVINDATSVPGTTEVIVTAQNGTTSLTYNVHFIPYPVTTAPVPQHDPAHVISMFSDAYTDVPVDTWLTVWSQAALQDIDINGDAVKKYTDVNFFGVETVGPNLLDVTTMTHLHLDIWSPDGNDFKLKLVDFGPDGNYGGGDDSEHEMVFTSPAVATWISYDLPLSDFTGLNITGNMAQYIMVKAPLGTLYLDNMYFYREIYDLELNVFLEGPFSGTQMASTLNPGLLPLAQPYNADPWFYNGTESVAAIPNAKIVDWVLVELRDAPSAAAATSSTMVARKAAFVERSGKIVDINGSTSLVVDVPVNDSLFVVIWHRNHLNVLSAWGLVRTNGVYSYNFTTAQGQAYGGNQVELSPGVWGMIAGNGVADNKIDNKDLTFSWDTEAGEAGYLNSDFNMDGETNNLDKNELWEKNQGMTSDQWEMIWEDNFDFGSTPAPDK
ncbi:MAG: hypothetical protein Kow00127_20340 [Bacteroidales bacterium]